MSTIQRIFQDHAEAYLDRFGDTVSGLQRKTIAAVCECRTGLRGHHLFQCPHCGDWLTASASCGNRHCPVCQNHKASEWVHRQQSRLLPCTYFLATFTVPHELHETIRRNQKAIYDAIMDCAAASLRALEADKRFVGCNLAGFFGVLHTWGRQIQYNPHVHFVIPGGGLSQDQTEWVAASGDFLVHVRALSKMFRGKMRDALRKAGLLGRIDPQLWSRNWVVDCKSVGSGHAAMRYLGAYVFRVAVSDARIAHYDGETVTIKYRKVGSSRWRRVNLPVFEFIRRYLQHVLPKGFVKVRHYGFLSPNCTTSIQKIREMICVLYELLREDLAAAASAPVKRPLRCPSCHAVMRPVRFVPALGPVAQAP